MSDMVSQSAIVREVAQGAARRITRKVIAALQQMKHALSGDDSGLKTAWDEICAQVQEEESYHWNAYDETVRQHLGDYVEQLPRHEREAIWFQTDAALEWECEEPEDREVYPVLTDDIVDYLVQEYVYAKAGQWSNRRIRAYIERADIWD